MHRIVLALCLVIALSAVSTAQNRWDYGIGLNVNSPVVSKSKTGFSNNGGLGIALHSSYLLPNNFLAMSGQFQLNRLGYYSPADTSNIGCDLFELYLGVKRFIPAMDSSVFSLHFVPAYSNSFRSQSKNALDQASINPLLNHTFDIGIHIGTEIRLSPYVGMEVSYTHRLLQQTTPLFFDAQPHCVRLALNFHFKKVKMNRNANSNMSVMLDSLKNDTLYVVNSACSEKMTNTELEKYFKEAYYFSAFKVISVNQVDSVRNTMHPLFYAYVGELYGGYGEPPSAGIFLMDASFNLTVFPYPVNTAYHEPLIGSPCFESLDATMHTIRSFNRRLINSL